MMDYRPDLRAPGAAQPAPATAERQRAVALAREYLRAESLGDMACVCRELLRSLGLPE
jgi:hypothetical protein